MRIHRRVLGATALAVTASLLVAACAGTPSGHSSRVGVVAAENVYGDIASQLGGRFAAVTSIISSPTADPHLYQPTTANAAEVAGAGVVIDNGLGYDAFVDRLLSASPSSKRQVVTVADVLHVRGADANPHLWYDIPRIPIVARAITSAMIRADRPRRGYFLRRLRRFDQTLRPLLRAIAEIRAKAAGAPVAYTEPVPGYLVAAAGLSVRTPDAFARAIEQGSDPSPQAVSAMEALLTGGRVKLLLYNSQATSAITDRLRTLAVQHGVPVVPVTETLPPGLSFQAWQLRQIGAIAKALGV